MSELSQKKALLAMTLCSVCWCFSSLFIKLCPLSAFQVACGRGFVAATVLTLYLTLIEKKRVIINKTVFFVSIFVCFKYITFITANKLTAGANCVAMSQTSIIFVLLFTCIMEKRLPAGKDIAVIVAVFTGIALFFFGKFDFNGILGNLLALGCGICTAVLFFMSGKFKTFEENLSSIILGNFISSALAFILSIGQPVTINFTAVSSILFLGIIQQALAFILYSKAIRVISPFACAVLATLEPVLSPILLLIFLNEKPSEFAFFGIVLVIGSIIIWNIANAKSKNKA